MLDPMAIDFRCDYCGRQLSLAPSLAGQETTCPNCGVTLLVPGVDPALAPTAMEQPLEQPVAAQKPAGEATVPCPYCGERIRPRASKCQFCGEHLQQGQVARGGTHGGSDPSVDNAATISLVLGLVGILFCGLAAPFAIWQAGVAKQRALALGIPVPGTATAGAILGWVVVALMVLGVLFVFLIFGLAAVGSAF